MERVRSRALSLALRRAVALASFLVVSGHFARGHDIHFPDSEHGTMVLEVKSDLTFPDGFDRIDVISADGDGHRSFSWSVTKLPRAGQDYTRGVRVLERDGFHNSVIRVEVRLLKSGCVVVSKPVRLDMNEGEIRVAAVLLPKPSPEIRWRNPSPIIHGTRLGPAQLDATARTEFKASLPGTFSYFPREGTLLPTGSHELSVTFTPDNTDSFHRATKSVTIYVASSPGNLIDLTDEDGDGYTFLLEEAFLMDPSVRDPENAPMLGVMEVGGKPYLHYTFRGQGGGTGVNPHITSHFEYYVEVSGDLEQWSHAGADVVLKDRFSIPGRGTVHVFRSATPIEPGRREFIRVRVVRR